LNTLRFSSDLVLLEHINASKVTSVAALS